MPLSEADLTAVVNRLGSCHGSDQFVYAHASYTRHVQEMLHRSREVTEVIQRTWEVLQNIPKKRPAADGDAFTKRQVISFRARALPRIKNLDRLLKDMQVSKAMEYLDKSHELRSTKAFTSGEFQRRARADLSEFSEACGGLYSMKEIEKDIDIKALDAFGAVVGTEEESKYKNFLGWIVNEFELQGAKLGPFYVVTDFSPAPRSTSGYRQSLPHVFPKKGAIVVNHRGGYFWHPHVGSPGAICWGDVQSAANSLVKAGDYYSLADLVDSVLDSWNPQSPYCPLLSFAPGGKKLKWLCSCGRQTVGAEPALRDISFFSCEACAADTCSKCLTGCRQCGLKTLCTGCQRSLEGKSAGGTPLPKLGPLCPDCVDILLPQYAGYHIVERMEDDPANGVPTSQSSEPAPADAPADPPARNDGDSEIPF